MAASSDVVAGGVFHGALILPAGEDTGTLVIATADDALPEPDGALTVAIPSSDQYKQASEWEAHVRVRDDDQHLAPVVSLAAAVGAREGAAAVFTLHADPAPAVDLNVRVRLEVRDAWLSEAELGRNERTGKERTVAIAAGATRAELRVGLRGDGAAVPDGAVRARLLPGDGYYRVTAQRPVASVTNVTGGAEGQDVVFTLEAVPAPTAPLEVGVTIAASGDFGIAPGERTVTLPTSGRATLTLETQNDDTDEPDGSVGVTLKAGEGYSLGEATVLSTPILDDDEPGQVGTPLPAVHPLVKYASLVKGFYDRITANHQHGDGTSGGWNKRFLKAMGHPEYVDYPQAAVTVADATRLWNHGGPGANTAWDGTVEAVTYAERYFAGKTPWPLPRMTVADARVDEAPGARLEFTVTLSGSAGRHVTVDYRTRDGTATAGSDYTAASGTLRFAPGETGKTVTVDVHDDVHDEGEETLELVLSGPAGAELERPVATGTIVNTDPMPKAWLARFGRMVAEQVVEGVSGRWEAARNPGFEGRIAGASLGGEAASHETAADVPAESRRPAFDWLDGAAGAQDEERSMTPRELLLQSDFTLTGAPDDGGGSWALWARMDESRFAGAEGGLSVDGEVMTGLFGMDFARENWLAGLALTLTESEGRYTSDGGGDVEATLTALAPYGHLRLDGGLSMWGALGLGAGALRLKTQGDAWRADTTWRMAAAGLRDELVEVPLGGGLGLAAKSDLLWARTTSAPVPGLAGAAADVTRLRAGLEGTWTATFERGGTLTPKLEAGLRHDGGDAETGWGVELGSGFAWTNPALGLDLSVEGRGLIDHENDAFRTYGYAAGLAFDPRPDTERGLSLTLGHDAGGASSGGVESLFAPGAPAETGAERASGGRWKAEAAFGLHVTGHFTGVSYLARAWSDTNRDTTLGWRLAPDRDRSGLSFDLKAVRTESDSAAPEHTVGFELGLQW